jgi:hypothetical protein
LIKQQLGIFDCSLNSTIYNVFHPRKPIQQSKDTHVNINGNR